MINPYDYTQQDACEYPHANCKEKAYVWSYTLERPICWYHAVKFGCFETGRFERLREK